MFGGVIGFGHFSSHVCPFSKLLFLTESAKGMRGYSQWSKCTCSKGYDQKCQRKVTVIRASGRDETEKQGSFGKDSWVQKANGGRSLKRAK